MTTVSEEILLALAEAPDGEAPISAIRHVLSRPAAKPRNLADRAREMRNRAKLTRSLSFELTAINIFTNGLVERPRDGVWRITPAGRRFISALLEPKRG